MDGSFINSSFAMVDPNFGVSDTKAAIINSRIVRGENVFIKPTVVVVVSAMAEILFRVIDLKGIEHKYAFLYSSNFVWAVFVQSDHYYTFSHFSSNQIAITLFSLFSSNQITISIFSL